MADKKGYVGVPAKRPRGKQVKSKGELLAEYGDMINAVEGSSGDPKFVKSGIKTSLPSVGYKKDRLYCVTDADKEGVYLDLGDGVTAPLKVSGNDIRNTSGTPVVKEADTLCIRTGATEPGIYFDDGVAINRVANLNTKLVPRQYHSTDSSVGTYNDNSWYVRHTQALTSGLWIIKCYWEAKGIDGVYFNFRLHDGTTWYCGGDTTNDFRQDIGTANYGAVVCMAVIPYATSRTMYLDFGGDAARGVYIRKSYFHAIEYLEGG